METLKNLPHIDQEIQTEITLGPHDLLARQQFYFCTEYEDLMKTALEYQFQCLWEVTAARQREKR